MIALVQRIPRYDDIPEGYVMSLPSSTLTVFADALKKWSCDLLPGPLLVTDLAVRDAGSASCPVETRWRGVECGDGSRGGKE